MTEGHNPLEFPDRPELVIDLHDGTSSQVSIIVVHHDRPEYLNICLQSIYISSGKTVQNTKLRTRRRQSYSKQRKQILVSSS